MGKMAVSDKCLTVTFDGNKEPQYNFIGAWNIKDLGHTRAGLFRAYKHYMKEVRTKENAESNV